MQTASNHHDRIYYPPGGILVWIIVFVELLTFGLAMVGMVFFAKEHGQLFHSSRLQLQPLIGLTNTLVLLTSGFFMAVSVHYFKNSQADKAARFLIYTILGGGLFVVLKAYEYYDKIAAGIGLYENMFFTFYWVLTAFHLLHIIAGLMLLAGAGYRLINKRLQIDDMEAAAVFWHMCDLIWLLLFPFLYLMF